MRTQKKDVLLVGKKGALCGCIRRGRSRIQGERKEIRAPNPAKHNARWRRPALASATNDAMLPAKQGTRQCRH
jgi:hypothetical protein